MTVVLETTMAGHTCGLETNLGPLLVLVLVQYTTSTALVQNNRQSLLFTPSCQYRKKTTIFCIC